MYRVLQSANLLRYYEPLIEMGGDDVQQLCDAGEEEFLEIMALVGMASKPLHVRRLQKALQKWVTDPTSFHQSPNVTTTPKTASSSTQILYSPELTNPSISPFGATSSFSSIQPIFPSSSSSASSNIITSSPASTTINLIPTLTEQQINKLTTAAERLSRQLQLEPKPPNSKKRSSRELEQVMAMTESDPRRMDEIRKYAAIYGRFDCKRKPEKPLTLHEVCVIYH